jgi:hypothetical protein
MTSDINVLGSLRCELETIAVQLSDGLRTSEGAYDVSWNRISVAAAPYRPDQAIPMEPPHRLLDGPPTRGVGLTRFVLKCVQGTCRVSWSDGIIEAVRVASDNPLIKIQQRGWSCVKKKTDQDPCCHDMLPSEETAAIFINDVYDRLLVANDNHIVLSLDTCPNFAPRVVEKLLVAKQTEKVAHPTALRMTLQQSQAAFHLLIKVCHGNEQQAILLWPAFRAAAFRNCHARNVNGPNWEKSPHSATIPRMSLPGSSSSFQAAVLQMFRPLLNKLEGWSKERVEALLRHIIKLNSTEDAKSARSKIENVRKRDADLLRGREQTEFSAQKNEVDTTIIITTSTGANSTTCTSSTSSNSSSTTTTQTLSGSVACPLSPLLTSTTYTTSTTTDTDSDAPSPSAVPERPAFVTSTIVGNMDSGLLVVDNYPPPDTHAENQLTDKFRTTFLTYVMARPEMGEQASQPVPVERMERNEQGNELITNSSVARIDLEFANNSKDTRSHVPRADKVLRDLAVEGGQVGEGTVTGTLPMLMNDPVLNTLRVLLSAGGDADKALNGFFSTSDSPKCIGDATVICLDAPEKEWVKTQRAELGSAFASTLSLVIVTKGDGRDFAFLRGHTEHRSAPFAAMSAKKYNLNGLPDEVVFTSCFGAQWVYSQLTRALTGLPLVSIDQGSFGGLVQNTMGQLRSLRGNHLYLFRAFLIVCECKKLPRFPPATYHHMLPQPTQHDPSFYLRSTLRV